MKGFKYIAFFCLFSCTTETNYHIVEPDLVIVIKSRNDQPYFAIMDFPRYFPLSKSETNSQNSYVAYFSIQSDSVEYTLENVNNRNQVYLSIRYKHRIEENYKEGIQSITFQDFKVTYCSADSFKFFQNQLWLYCE